MHQLYSLYVIGEIIK